MRIAAIDLGSNTFHLIIAEKKKESIEILYKINKPIKLSENITKNNAIIPAAYNRGINCLAEFKKIIESYSVEKVKAVATSAVRSAINGEEFINSVRLDTGIEIQIISGDEEALYIFEGIKASGAILEKSLIMDIGGGSVEFIFCDEKKAYWKKSFDIGAARLMQNFWHSDPLNLTDHNAIIRHLDETLLDVLEYNNSFGVMNLIGSAGAFETYYEILNIHNTVENIDSADLILKDYIALSHKLIQSTHADREKIPNLIPLRVDMIVMACIITNYIIEKMNIKKLKMSTYDLKYGLLDTL